MNIVSTVSQFLTPDLVAKMASASGISDRTTTQKAVGAAVPAILSSLASLASKPEGAQQLAGTIAKQPPNMLEGLAEYDWRIRAIGRYRQERYCPPCLAAALSVHSRRRSAGLPALAKA